MNKLNPAVKLSLFVWAALLLAACSTTKTVETYHPGYYQPGRYYSGGYQTAYNDVYGNYHPAHDVGAYYEQGRWHRPFVDVVHYQHAGTLVAPCKYRTRCTSGNTISFVLDDATVGFIAADGDLDSVWEPTNR